MRNSLESDPAGFCKEVVPVLRQVKETPGYRHLLWLISVSKILPRVLCDPDLLNEDEAAALTERLRKIEPSIETNLLKEVFGVDGTGGLSLAEPACGLRFLSLFGGKVNDIHLLPVVARLLRHPNATIRSKAATMLGKMSRDYDWLEQTRNESDDRVRSNAMEALWEPGIPERFRGRLWEGVKDPSNRVVGNALLGLYRQGDPGCIPVISSMTKHPQENFRATAAWVIAETGDERFREYLFPLLQETSPPVRKNALQAMQKLDERAAFTGIERVQLVMFSLERGTAMRRPHPFDISRETPAKDAGPYPTHLIHVAAVSQQGSPVANLLATDFRVMRDASLLEHYAVHNEPPADVMSFAFALPSADATGARLSNTWRGFLSRFFKQKRHLDYWAFLEYSDRAANALRANQAPTTPQKAAFLRNSLELEDFLNERMPSSPPAQLGPALELLLTPPRFARNPGSARKGSLHAVLVESSGYHDLPRERVQAVIQAAINRGFIMHVISSNRSSALAELPAVTGGAFLMCQEDVASWQRQLATLYASFFATYGIEFEAATGAEADETRIRVIVRKGPLFGELRTSCSLRTQVCIPA